VIEEQWSQFIGFLQQYVVPDWGSLVNLLPVFLLILIVVVLGWTFYRLLTAGPTRRGKRRLPAVPPPGTHMPGPTFAPILGAFGAFVMVASIVVGGAWLLFGAAILAVTLLYWGKLALQDYDHIPGVPPRTAGMLAPPPGSPPPGVHIPAPSFRPILVAMSLTLVVGGLVVGGWALIFGFVALVLTTLGWLRDARREYGAVVDADRTGHLDAGPAPDWPRATFALLALLLAGGLLFTSGILPNSAGSASASGAPAASGGAGGGGGGQPSQAPATSNLPPTDVQVTAENISFQEKEISATAGKPFTIGFDNKDSGQPHNVAIKDASGQQVFMGEIVTGPKTVVYKVDALQAGTYQFVCSVHPTMTGTLDVK
jgi:plastocyanin